MSAASLLQLESYSLTSSYAKVLPPAITLNFLAPALNTQLVTKSFKVLHVSKDLGSTT